MQNAVDFAAERFAVKIEGGFALIVEADVGIHIHGAVPQKLLAIKNEYESAFSLINRASSDEIDNPS
jgi:hypothetical protein